MHKSAAFALLCAATAAPFASCFSATRCVGIAARRCTAEPCLRRPKCYSALSLPALSRNTKPRQSALSFRCSVDVEPAKANDLIALKVSDDAPGQSGTISPRQAREQLEMLAAEGRWEKAAVLQVLNSMHGNEGHSTRPLFNSSTILFRRTTANEIQMLTRGTIKPGTLDLNGDDDMEVLNQAFYATLFSAMFLSTVAATVIPDVPDLPFLRDSVLRFVVTFGIGALPFAFLGAGLSVPGLLQAALIQVRRLISEEFRQRLVVHEAGHLLVGYCMGLPVADYKANDPILNACQFFGLSFFLAPSFLLLPSCTFVAQTHLFHVFFPPASLFVSVHGEKEFFGNCSHGMPLFPAASHAFLCAAFPVRMHLVFGFNAPLQWSRGGE